MISTGVRQAPYALNGLLHHESDLDIEDHFTDTGGYTDQIFALFHLLGYRFAPPLRRFNDCVLYTPAKTTDYPLLDPMIGGRINPRLIQQRWDGVLRLASSVKLGTVTASLVLQRLSRYARQNDLAQALQESGRIEKTLFMLTWLQDPALRQRAQVARYADPQRRQDSRQRD